MTTITSSRQKDDYAVERVSSCLRSCGYNVERIPETDEKRPDLVAFSETEAFVVEVKMNQDAAASPNRDGVTLMTRTVEFNNSISGIVEKAGRQLQSLPSMATPHFAILAYFATGLDAEGRLDQVKATLYGEVDVLELGTTLARRCYYFDHAEFYRQAHIDGALLIHNGGGMFCVNEFSDSVEALRRTALFSRHAECEAIRDPIVEEHEQRAWAVREPLRRGNDDPVLEHLQAKYGTGRLVSLRWKRHVAAAPVPVPPSADSEDPT